MRWREARPHKAGGVGVAMLPPHQSIARLAAPHIKQIIRAATAPQTNKPRSDRAAKGGGAAHHQPRFAAHPQRGTGGDRFEQTARLAAPRRRPGARDITGVVRTAGAERSGVVAQQLCITPCYVKAHRDLPPACSSTIFAQRAKTTPRSNNTRSDHTLPFGRSK